MAGIDVDPVCKFPFEVNNRSKFIQADVRTLDFRDVAKLFPKGVFRVLAGCAPCRPFSPFRRGSDNSGDDEWGLLSEFGRLISGVLPEFVTMENVPDLASKPVFEDFVNQLESLGYQVDYRSVHCPRFGIPQYRRRLVLLGSLLGAIKVPAGSRSPEKYKTVRDAIASLPRLASGETDPKDQLHKTRSVTVTNLRRLRASLPGGTWHDWPDELKAQCHRKDSGASYQNVYSRMTWDEPSPTITTQAYSFGTGRFGHPEQDRSISLREAAILQSFPRRYRFVDSKDPVYFVRAGRLIGNAVPPRLAGFVGRTIVRAASCRRRQREKM